MTELENQVLETIRARRLTPRPYSFFLARRSVFWTLAIVSVLLGGISVAILIFGFTDYLATGGQGFDEMPFDDVAELLPAISLIFFLLFIGSAVLSVARTRRGYRYRPRNVAAIAAGLSILFGFLLYSSNAGTSANRFLKERFPAYAEYTYIPYAEWSRPNEGLLGGAALSVEDGGRTLRLQAFDGKEWNVDISAAQIGFKGSPVEEGDVAIQGARTGPLSFRAVRVDEFD